MGRGSGGGTWRVGGSRGEALTRVEGGRRKGGKAERVTAKNSKNSKRERSDEDVEGNGKSEG